MLAPELLLGLMLRCDWALLGRQAGRFAVAGCGGVPRDPLPSDRDSISHK